MLGLGRPGRIQCRPGCRAQLRLRPGPGLPRILRRRCRPPPRPDRTPRSSSMSSCPPERLNRAIDDAVRRLSRRTRVPGFRPGKAPRPVLERHLGDGVVLDEAVEHLVGDAYREAMLEQDVLPLTSPDVEIVQAEEGKPLIFKAIVQVRPEVVLGDYKQFNFSPEIDTIDDVRVEPGARRAARPERDTRCRGGPGRPGRGLRRHLIRGITRRRPVRGRDLRADAAHPRAGAPDPGVRDAISRGSRSVARPSSTSPSPTTTRRPSWPARRPTSRSSSASFARRSCPSSTPTSSRPSATSPTSMRCARTSGPGWSGARSTAHVTASPTGSSTTPSRTRPWTSRRSSSTRRSR